MKADVIKRVEDRIARLDQHDCSIDEFEGSCSICFRIMQENIKLNKIRSNDVIPA